MQTLVALLIGLAYGFPLGVATVLLYLAQGAVGLPVFAGTPEKGIGLMYLLGPTGGYLIGFALAAAITGWVAERRRDAGALALAVVAGTVAIYAPGVLWLARFVGFEQALGLGLVPFLWGDILKAVLALVLALAGAAMVRRRLGA
jgi:biotin transport system substrate-specific component